ncbi:MAG: hypothetical protein A2107_01235 [Verrucomicrobia bacterium GWF2_62_7]|nr:MAG: hypothetical protein A2107_01235 [Verrucomicrobia bacterium GWF2_62_7]
MTSMVRLMGLLVISAAIMFAGTIDSFNGIGTVTTARDIYSDTVAVTSTDGIRTIFADKTGGATGIALEGTVVAIEDGFFAGSAGAGVSGTTGAIYVDLWDLSSPTQGLAIDLIHNDLPGSTIAFWISDGTHTATSGQFALPVIMGGAEGQTIIALLGGFSGIGSVNLSAITSLGFTNSHAVNGDLELDNFRTYVPEPGTYAMMAAGLLGLYSIRRKRA